MGECLIKDTRKKIRVLKEYGKYARMTPGVWRKKGECERCKEYLSVEKS